ncbi:MAG TPA: methyltransferase domain-containing protein [Stellaceae bacterium]|nr:methyltransferase domain-containing protein [Stellaceae bacterium]
MQRCYDFYVAGQPAPPGGKLTVVEIGSEEFNGAYRHIFADERFAYVGCDRALGPGVDIVLDNPYKLPLPDASADYVISGQMLEHCEFFWLSFAEMLRVLKPDGYLFLIAPSGGPIHNYPVDCYRFYPDAFHALARYSGCQLLDLWHDDRGPWKDLVGIFRHATAAAPDVGEITANLVASQQEVQRRLHDTGMIGQSSFDAPPEADRTQGAASYLATLGQLHQAIAPQLYFEIGVRHGRSLALASGNAIAVDPAPDLQTASPPGATIFRETSDFFFLGKAQRELARGVDLAFIDGMHRSEYVLRDVMNVERFARPTLVAAIDDVFPSHPVQAARDRRSRVWCGDVWKIPYILARYRPDLLMLRLDVEPAGLLLVAGFDPSSRALRDEYNPIARELVYTSPADPPTEVLNRQGALVPDDPRIASLLVLLRELAQASANYPAVRARLAAWRAENRL